MTVDGDGPGDGGLLPPEVVTGGEPMVLLLATGDLPLAAARTFQAEVAGAESNLAIGLARLGHRVAFFGRVGADVFGDRIRRELRGEGVDVAELHTDAERPTGLLFRDTVRGAPITVHYRRQGSASTALGVGDVPRRLIAGARVLHVTGITAALSEGAFEAVLEAMRWARESEVTVSLDPNVRLSLADPPRWAEIVDALARLADLVLTGAEEAPVFCGQADPLDWLAERGVRTVVLKHGARGASEHALSRGAVSSGEGMLPGEAVHEPARTVPEVDPVGAGDAFDAAWLSGWLRGLGPAERLREACAVASLAVTVRGDATGAPDAELRRRILAQGRDVER